MDIFPVEGLMVKEPEKEATGVTKIELPLTLK